MPRTTPTAYDLAEQRIPAATVTAALSTAVPAPYWLDRPERPAPLPPLDSHVSADLAVVGGGYTGLWTALLAKERDASASVVLLEGQEVGWAASGRNGGFVSASLTHGYSNGVKHLPGEVDLLQEMGDENLAEFAETLERYGIDCGFEWNGTLALATEPHQVDWLREEAGHDGVEFFDRDKVQAEVKSPLYLAGAWNKKGSALVDPARLAWGLKRACLELGVQIFEHSPVRSLAKSAHGVQLKTGAGTVSASKVALATNVFPSLLRRARLHTVPVYDYALMTEPLTEAQLESIGWSRRQGLDDVANRFHYYRLTEDSRILFGGYDAPYHYGRSMKPEYDQSEESFRRLAAHFLATFPQLEGISFTHKWGGAIDTCSRFFSFFMKAYSGRVAYAAGFTGLGVGASRFAANVLLDLLTGSPTRRTSLELVRKLPLPFPPEPVAWLGVKITTAAMVRSDRRQGKRGPWLKLMDAVGMGFDS